MHRRLPLHCDLLTLVLIEHDVVSGIVPALVVMVYSWVRALTLSEKLLVHEGSIQVFVMVSLMMANA